MDYESMKKSSKIEFYIRETFDFAAMVFGSYISLVTHEPIAKYAIGPIVFLYGATGALLHRDEYKSTIETLNLIEAGTNLESELENLSNSKSF